MVKNRYVGHRYIPIFENGWDKTRTYEPLTFVYHDGKTYVSRKYVPTNIEIENNDFWAFFLDNAPQIFTPKFTGQWEDKTYEPLSIVINNRNTYVSKQNVPIETELTNTNYWLDLSTYYNQLFTDYEAAEQERQNAELIRAENEKKRNLTSVDEFIKLQDSIGGRNYVTKNYSTYNTTGVYACRKIAEVGEPITLKITIKDNNVQLPNQTRFGLTVNGVDANVGFSWISTNKPEETRTEFAYFSFYPKTEEVLKAITDKYYLKIEKGSKATPYTKAPEDYELVSKEDYYNHIKLMNDFKDNQFKQVKQAVIALGGTI